MASVEGGLARMTQKSHDLLEDVAAKSHAGIFHLGNTQINETSIKNCWDAFGGYVARQLRNGKGVIIPKFGNFTFSPTEVNLTGVTNPGERNKLLRQPVFIIGKDFTPGITLRPGLATGQTVRPFDVKGSSGSIPQVKINYMDISLMSGYNKDTTKNSIERIIRQLSDQARKGENSKMSIPQVGIYLLKGKVAGVAFEQFLHQDARNNIGNKMLTIQSGPSPIKYPSLGGMGFSKSVTGMPLRMSQQQGVITLTPDAEQWLRHNLNVDLEKEGVVAGRPRTRGGERLHSATHSRGSATIEEMKTIDRFFSHTPDSKGLKNKQLYSAKALSNRPRSEYGNHRPKMAWGAEDNLADKRRASVSLANRSPEYITDGKPYEEAEVDAGMVEAVESLIEHKAFARTLCAQRDIHHTHQVPIEDLSECLLNAGVNQLSLIYLPGILKQCGAGVQGDPPNIKYELFLSKLPWILREAKKKTEGGGMVVGSRRGRPRSAYSAITAGTATSELAKGVSMEKIMWMAQTITTNRSAIVSYINQRQMRAIDKRSYTEILRIFKALQLSVEGRVLRALIKHANSLYKGLGVSEITPSVMDVLKSAQNTLFGGSTLDDRDTLFQREPPHEESQKLQRIQSKQGQVERAEDVEAIINQLRDILYSVKKTIREIFEENQNENEVLDKQAFAMLVKKYSLNKIGPTEANSVFRVVTNGNPQLTFENFERSFKWQIPFGDWETVALRRIKKWISTKNMSCEQAFDLILKYRGHNVDQKINRYDFHKAIIGEDFDFNAPQVDYLFRLLDINNDGFVDKDEWLSRLHEDENAIQYLRDVILKYNLSADDLLFKMKMKLWDSPLSYDQLFAKIKLLDPSLTIHQIKNIGKALKNRNNQIEVPTLIRNLTGKEFETVDYTKKIMTDIYNFVNAKHKERELREYLEALDVNQDGTLSRGEFIAALTKLGTGINETELKRFVHMIEKTKNERVDYIEFIDKMTNTANKHANPFKSIITRINMFLSQNSLSCTSLMRRLTKGEGNKRVTITQFAEFLKAKVSKKRTLPELLELSGKMDLDQDGYIDESDVATCLGNVKNEAFCANNGVNTQGYINERKFYPTKTDQQLTPAQASELCIKIMDALAAKGLAPKEVFTLFDKNNNQFLSFAELSAGLDTILQISQFYKEKLFALMDENSIGMVSFANFKKVLEKKGVLGDVVKDSFNWENEIIKKIKSWVKENNLSVEDAFKNFDLDFDGFVGKEDLRGALINILKIPRDTIINSKVDRLFRLLDQYKTNSIQLADFRRLIEGDNQLGFERTVNKTKLFSLQDSYDWKLNGLQQIGLILSKKYGDLSKSFDEIADHHAQLSFEHFNQFVEKSRALHGFNLTKELMHEMYAQLDPHKKGYLTENDWNNAFSKYNWNEQCLAELKNMIASNFADNESAFEFFLSFAPTQTRQKRISQTAFAKALTSLSSKRFTQNDLTALWKSCCPLNQKSIDLNTFSAIFNQMRFAGKSTMKSVTGNTGKSWITSTSQYDENPFEKLKHHLKSSFINLDQAFIEYDSSGSGEISTLQFRNAIRKLNLGLTAREIDRILNEIDQDGDGRVNWKNFSSRFSLTESDQRILHRSKVLLQKLKDLMISYMISPKDTFRVYDTDRTGKLPFGAFNKMVTKLYSSNNEEVPTYPIIKDLFDTIDIRKDGVLDQHEWNQTFKVIQSRRITGGMKEEGGSEFEEWEASKEFEHMCGQIGKNRKLIQEHCESKSDNEGYITYADGAEALQTVLREYKLPREYMNILLSAGEHQGMVDYKKMLTIYKNRYSTSNLFPKSYQIQLSFISKYNAHINNYKSQ